MQTEKQHRHLACKGKNREKEGGLKKKKVCSEPQGSPQTVVPSELAEVGPQHLPGRHCSSTTCAPHMVWHSITTSFRSFQPNSIAGIEYRRRPGSR